MVSYRFCLFLNAGLLAGILPVRSAQLAKPLFDVPSIPQPPPQTLTSPRPEISPERRGDILMARKMYREAIELYREGPADSAVTWNKIGIAYHQLMDLGAAKKNYEQAVKLNRHYAEAINNLGTIFYAQKNYRRAIGRYKQALKISPQSASIYSNLGTAYFGRKNYKEAAEAYQTALSLDPEVFEHKGGYGVMLQERSVTERAKFHYYLARTYAQAGQNERALLYIRKALEEGFAERKKLLEDAEFSGLRSTPEFQELLTLEPRVL
ncbi:MAG: tetratricopeptide repeat protein [Acidobacteriota bacterium]|nr:tetratricopeptide repeat protein [Acidobacteriota bacterium]